MAKMPRLVGAIVAIAAAVVLSGCIGARRDACGEIKVGSYNVRNSRGDRQTPNCWEARKAALVDLVRELDLDVFGLQEVLPDQAAYFRSQLPDWEFVGDHRGADRVSDEASPVFYRRSRFEPLKTGTFWLSETPEVPASKSWNTRCTRVCSYAILRDRATGKEFCFANTHTDHRSAEAREKGMRLVIDRMGEFGHGVPIVFVGDHNNTEIEAPAKSVAARMRNALYLSRTPPAGPWRTFNGWRWREREIPTREALELPETERNIPNNDCEEIRNWFLFLCGGMRIDYIYVSEGVEVLDYATRSDARPGCELYPSDHFPITATLRFLGETSCAASAQ